MELKASRAVVLLTWAVVLATAATAAPAPGLLMSSAVSAGTLAFGAAAIGYGYQAGKGFFHVVGKGIHDVFGDKTPTDTERQIGDVLCPANSNVLSCWYVPDSRQLSVMVSLDAAAQSDNALLPLQRQMIDSMCGGRDGVTCSYNFDQTRLVATVNENA